MLVFNINQIMKIIFIINYILFVNYYYHFHNYILILILIYVLIYAVDLLFVNIIVIVLGCLGCYLYNLYDI